MRDRKWTRRDLLKASTASAAGLLFAEPLKAAAPPAADVTPALIEAAKKEGKLSFYSALELNTAERLARTFEAKYPGITVRVERSGAERIFQRIAQEQGSGIKAVDVANSTDPAHYLEWKKNDWLAPYLPSEVVRHFPADQIDPDGQNGQGASGLQRRHPDHDLPAGARSRLAVSGKARPAEDHAGAVGRRSAKEDPARRACRHGRRQ
jgi:iron(III) transport system substrate-binding protein